MMPSYVYNIYICCYLTPFTYFALGKEVEPQASPISLQDIESFTTTEHLNNRLDFVDRRTRNMTVNEYILFETLRVEDCGLIKGEKRKFALLKLLGISPVDDALNIIAYFAHDRVGRLIRFIYMYI
jgi:hypothetical protein